MLGPFRQVISANQSAGVMRGWVRTLGTEVPEYLLAVKRTSEGSENDTLYQIHTATSFAMPPNFRGFVIYDEKNLR